MYVVKIIILLGTYVILPLSKEFINTSWNLSQNSTLLSTLMKKNKQAYDKYFERNWNIMNTWKGIKSLISLKTVASSVPAVLTLDNGDTITNPYDIANTFTNYFAFIAAVPFFKKDSKFNYSNYHPISLLWNIGKILEKLMYKRLYIYLNNNNIACNFQFGFTEKYCTSHTLIYIRIKEKLLMMEI